MKEDIYLVRLYIRGSNIYNLRGKLENIYIATRRVLTGEELKERFKLYNISYIGIIPYYLINLKLSNILAKVYIR